MEMFLRYLYTDKLTEEDASIELMRIAFKFKVTRLKSICSEIFCNSLTKKNAVENFIAGSELEEPYLVSYLSTNIIHIQMY